MMTALAFILSYVESILPLQLPVPGMKLGLANIVAVAALYCWGEKEALALSVIRVLLVSLTFGNMAALIYSLAGSLFSWTMMTVMKKTRRFDAIGVSVAGGMAHNAGQITAAMILLETEAFLYYLPFLMISGVVTGALIGIAAAEVTKRIKKIFL